MNLRQEDILNLSGKNWVPLPRVARVIPFGYEVSEEDPTMLVPVIFQLEALEQAKKHLKNGFSLRVVARWLSDVTGRYISHEGLNKRVDIERRRVKQASSLKKWAEAAETAIKKAKAVEQKLGISYEEGHDT